MAMAEKDFLGVGWKFPLAINSTGGISETHSEYKIKESIRIILGTAKGERIMRPDFGSDLHKLVFEPNDSVTKNLAVHYVEEALTLWEPRIQVEEITAENEIEAGRLIININYIIRAINSPQNLVYPFYLSE